jgi:hypothetical protein
MALLAILIVFLTKILVCGGVFGWQAAVTVGHRTGAMTQVARR